MMTDQEDIPQQGTIQSQPAQADELTQITYVVAYARVSTDDKGQNPETQLRAIRKWAERKGNIEILAEYKDKSSGTNDERPGLDSAIGFIHRNHRNDKKHLVTQLVIFDMDRLSRDMVETNRIIDDLRDLSVHLKVITNEDLDVNTREGMLMTSFHSFTAQGYTDGLGDKIKAGMQRARDEGKHIGRPLSRTNEFSIDLILGYASMGYSLRDVAKIHHCSRVTITNRLKDEGKLEEFKQTYENALASGKRGLGLSQKKYKPKKSESEADMQGSEATD